MRILWLTNAPTSEISDDLFNIRLNNASWTEALHRKLSSAEDVTMGYAFPWNTKKFIKKTVNRTQYYVIPNEGSLLEKVVNNLSLRIDSAKRLAHYTDIVNEFKPDIIHIFGTEKEAGLIQQTAGCPCVVQMQGILNNYVLYYFHAISPLTIFFNTKLHKWLTKRSYYHSYLKLKKQAVREAKILSLTKNVSGFTDFDKRAASIMGSDIKYYYIPWLLREPFYKATWTRPAENVRRIISTINPQTYKGLETIYRTSDLLNKVQPGKYEFVIAGISENADINRLVKRTLDKSVVANVTIHFMGNLSADRLVEELLKSHMMMHPSLCDTSPNSICEAMVLGMPVISTNVGGIPSIISDGETGCLVQNMDHLSFAYLVKYLDENPGKAITMGLKAREVALARHDQQKIVSNTLTMYKEMSRNGS